MKPTIFDGSNTEFAKNQPEYLPLPAHYSDEGIVTTCWQMTLSERVRVLFTGCMWLQTLTFKKPLQPQKLSAERPILGAPSARTP